MGETVSAKGFAIVRAIGLAIAIASGAGAAFVIAKLYTGRGGTTPIRAAIYEQPLVALLGLTGISFGLWIVLQPRALIDARAWLNPRWVWRERRSEAALLSISLALGLVTLELGSRALYARDEGLPFLHPPEFLVYPPLYHAMRDYDPAARNVLLLGGSVMNGAGRGDTMERLLGPPWRVYNLAQNAHCSLDSLTKYQWLVDHGYDFDYVLLYEAINETRLNNAPPDIFRDDYTHYLFYRLVHAVFGDDRPVWRAALHSALVFRADRLITQLRETRAFGRNFVNIAYPREDWLVYGSDVRSAKPFEANFLAIADLADETGARLLTGTFAYDGRLDSAADGTLDASAIAELNAYTKEWGLVANVRNGILAINHVVRRHRDRVAFFDTTALKLSQNFIDPCHFTEEAELEFVELLKNSLLDEELPE